MDSSEIISELKKGDLTRMPLLLRKLCIAKSIETNYFPTQTV